MFVQPVSCNYYYGILPNSTTSYYLHRFILLKISHLHILLMVLFIFNPFLFENKFVINILFGLLKLSKLNPKIYHFLFLYNLKLSHYSCYGLLFYLDIIHSVMRTLWLYEQSAYH